MDITYEDSNAFKPDDTIITEVVWPSNDTLMVRIMNRVQDQQKLYLVRKESKGWVARVVRDEKTIDGSWFNWLKPVTLIKDGAYVELQENTDGYAHLAYYKHYNQSKPTQWLTSGAFEVTKVTGVDSSFQIMYVIVKGLFDKKI